MKSENRNQFSKWYNDQKKEIWFFSNATWRKYYTTSFQDNVEFDFLKSW